MPQLKFVTAYRCSKFDDPSAISETWLGPQIDDNDDDDAQICRVRPKWSSDALSVPVEQVGLEMLSERQRRERWGSKGGWQTVPDMWTDDRKTPHPQCCRRPWHKQCVPLSADWRCRLRVDDNILCSVKVYKITR